MESHEERIAKYSIETDVGVSFICVLVAGLILTFFRYKSGDIYGVTGEYEYGFFQMWGQEMVFPAFLAFILIVVHYLQHLMAISSRKKV